MLKIHKESAGSGKTYKLAYEYICLLLGHRDPETGVTELYKTADNHRRILAITFTNKATDEMKRRIMHELALLAGMEPRWEGRVSSYLDDLVGYYHTTPEAIATAAREALLNLLFDFNYFHISTIDAFFQLVLRTFAREAELTGNYEVELDSGFAIKIGLDEMLNSVNHDPGSPESQRVVSWISDYLLRQASEGEFRNIFDRSNSLFKTLLGFLNDIDNEKLARNNVRMTAYLSDPDRIIRFRTALYSISDRLLREATEAARALEAYLAEGGADKSLLNSNFLKGIASWANPAGIPNLPAAVKKVSEDVGNAYVAKGKKKREKEGPDQRLDILIGDAAARIAACASDAPVLRQTASNVFVLGLLERLNYFIGRFRSENNLILLSDTNSLLKRIIGDDETPFVYERVGVWFRHFLIDEFQDTSGMQWDILRPLVDQSLSTGQDNLIIGDEKQCIYRFRDSDPTLLGYQIEKQLAYSLPPDYDPTQGNTNWRSSADVVSFNNALFSIIATAVGYGDIYSNVCQTIAPARLAHKGYVKLMMIPPASANEVAREIPDPEVQETPETEDVSAPAVPSDLAADEPALSAMADEIDRQLRSGYRGGDIAILTRRRGEAAKCIRYLEWRCRTDSTFSSGFRIISDDAMLLASSYSVRLLISLLRARNEVRANASVEERTPEIQAAAPRMVIPDTAAMINRYEYFHASGLPAEEALRKALDSDGIPGGETLSGRTSSVSPETLPSMVDRLIMEVIPEEARKAENMFISAFQDTVADYCSRNPGDTGSFLKWWDLNRHKLTVSAPEDRDAIRVMTIHKSKGLEFKCVHLPFASWELYSAKSYEWFEPAGFEPYMSYLSPDDIPPLLPFKPDSKLADSPYARQLETYRREQTLDAINLMYVAFTRAVDELIVIYPPSSVRNADSKISILIDAAVSSGRLEEELGERVTTSCSENILTVGEPTSASADRKSPPSALDTTSLTEMPAYASASREELWADTRLEDLSGLTEEAESADGSRERGRILHDVMASLDEGAGLKQTVMRLARQGVIPQEEAGNVREYLQRAIATVADYGWFAGYRKIMTRRRLVSARGTVVRADRIVWTAGGTVDIIDYRFGEEKAASHGRNMRILMRMMAPYAGGLPVRGFIWYLDRNRLVRVDPSEG